MKLLPLDEAIYSASPKLLWVVPIPALAAYYLCFFAFGALIQGAEERVRLVGRDVRLPAALALAALVPLVLLREGPLWAGPGAFSATPEGFGWMAAYSVGAWGAVFTGFGLGRRWLSAERASLRYAADSSYWIFLMHLPLAVLLVGLIAPLPLPFPVAWLVVVVVLFAVLVGLYELGVRHSALGRALNGPRPPRDWSLLTRLRGRLSG